jgi:hypothetical protein
MLAKEIKKTIAYLPPAPAWSRMHKYIVLACRRAPQ